MNEHRYLENETHFKKLAFDVLSDRFESRDRFDLFYSEIDSNSKKDEFLRVASSYLYMVKCGAWKVQHVSSNADIDYFDNSLKLVVIFALIESISDQQHQDFYDWLRQRSCFPLTAEKLKKEHDEYKASFGSIRRCVHFFSSLSDSTRSVLCNAIVENGKPKKSVKEVALFLYNLRSKFVHECKFVLQLSGLLTFSRISSQTVLQTTVSMGDLSRAFEEGLLAHFGRRAQIT